jgi:hypothetical protein
VGYSSQSQFPAEITHVEATDSPATTEIFPATTLAKKIARIEVVSAGDVAAGFNTITFQVVGGGTTYAKKTLTGEDHNHVIGGFELPAGGLEVVHSAGTTDHIFVTVYAFKP